MAKFTLKTEITKTEVVEKEISFPYFCKTIDDIFYKVISEKKALRVTDYNGSIAMIIVNPTGRHTITEISKASEITENEFDVIAYKALSDAEEIVKDKPSRFANVNEEIDQIIERRAS